MGGREDRRVVCQAKVVVRAEVQDATLADGDLGPLRPEDPTLVLREPSLGDTVEFSSQVILECSVHYSSVQSRMILPVLADCAAAKPACQSRAAIVSAMTELMRSRSVALVCSMAAIAFQVSNISRP